MGVNSIYNLTNKGFRVYIYIETKTWTVQQAKDFGWKLHYSARVDEWEMISIPIIFKYSLFYLRTINKTFRKKLDE